MMPMVLDSFRIPLGGWVSSAVDWMIASWSGFFNVISTIFQGINDVLQAILLTPPFWVWILVFTLLGWWAKGWKLALGSFLGFMLIYSMDQWDNAMQSLALVILASAIAVLIGIPLGIWAARSKRVSAVLRPILDFLQTMPAFVYLIPFVVLFSVGVVPAIVATILFAIAPAVRFTELGIKQVDKEVVEAAYAFGATPRRVLFQVQLPLARQTIMGGVNQVIMLSLSMVVIAGMVGAGGLGADVVTALNRVNMSLGAEAGLSVVILAMFLDRVTGSRAGRKAAAGDGAGGAGKSVLDRIVKPAALLAALALALGWTAVGAFGGSAGSDKTIRIGVASGWDEGVVLSNAMKVALEEQGYDVKLQDAEVGVIFTGLAEGDFDLLMDGWLPNTIKDYVDKYGDQIEDFGAWYDKAKLTIAVNKDAPIDSLDELAANADKFNNEIIGIDAGAGLTRVTKNDVIPQYGLEGMDFKISSTATMLGALKGAMQSGDDIVVTLWSPHWAYDEFDIKDLKDPKGALGGAEKCHSFGRGDFTKDNPEVAEMLKHLKVSDEQLYSLENYVLNEKEGKNLVQDTRDWMEEHPDFKKQFKLKEAAK